MNNFDIKEWPIIGHKKIINVLKNAILNKRLPHALLFSGVSNVGKTFVAHNFIKSIQCLNNSRPCGVCNSCKMIEGGIHPDITVYDKKTSLKIKSIRKLKHSLSLGTSISSYKVCLLNNVEKLTIEATNALLKILEEPSGKTVFILTTSNHEKLLPTIVSRCTLLNFSNPSASEINNYFSTEYKDDVKNELLKKIIFNSGNRPGIIFYYLKNKEKFEEINNLENNLEKILSNSDDYYQKLNQAAELVKKEKLELKKIFEVWKLYFRNMLFYKLNFLKKKEKTFSETILEKYSLKNISENICKINKAILLLSKNVNKKLLVENLIISL